MGGGNREGGCPTAKEIVMVFIDLRQLQNHVKLKHLDSLDATVKEFAMKKEVGAEFAVLQPQEVIWVPPGYIAIPVGSEHSSPVAKLAVAPWSTKSVREDFDSADCWDLVKGGLTAAARRNPDLAPWRKFGPAMEQDWGK